MLCEQRNSAHASSAVRYVVIYNGKTARGKGKVPTAYYVVDRFPRSLKRNFHVVEGKSCVADSCRLRESCCMCCETNESWWAMRRHMHRARSFGFLRQLRSRFSASSIHDSMLCQMYE